MMEIGATLFSPGKKNRLPSEIKKQARYAFQRADVNKDGVIDRYELVTALSSMGMCDPADAQNYVDGLLAQLDRDNNEKLEWGEFLDVVAMQVVEGRRERACDIRSAFLALGGNEDMTGFLETTKLKQIFEEFELTLGIDSG